MRKRPRTMVPLQASCYHIAFASAPEPEAVSDATGDMQHANSHVHAAEPQDAAPEVTLSPTPLGRDRAVYYARAWPEPPESSVQSKQLEQVGGAGIVRSSSPNCRTESSYARPSQHSCSHPSLAASKQTAAQKGSSQEQQRCYRLTPTDIAEPHSSSSGWAAADSLPLCPPGEPAAAGPGSPRSPAAARSQSVAASSDSACDGSFPLRPPLVLPWRPELDMQRAAAGDLGDPAPCAESAAALGAAAARGDGTVTAREHTRACGCDSGGGCGGGCGGGGGGASDEAGGAGSHAAAASGGGGGGGNAAAGDAAGGISAGAVGRVDAAAARILVGARAALRAAGDGYRLAYVDYSLGCLRAAAAANAANAANAAGGGGGGGGPALLGSVMRSNRMLAEARRLAAAAVSGGAAAAGLRKSAATATRALDSEEERVAAAGRRFLASVLQPASGSQASDSDAGHGKPPGWFAPEDR